MVTLNEQIYLDNLFLDLSVNTTAEMMKSRLEGAMGPSVGSITVSTTGTCHGQSWHLTFKTVGGDILPLEVMCSLTPVFLLIRMKAGANQANIKWRQRFFFASNVTLLWKKILNVGNIGQRCWTFLQAVSHLLSSQNL